MTKVLALIQLVVLLSYILYLVRKFGVLKSISQSTYELGRQKRFLFTAVLWIVASLNYFQPLGMYGALASGMLFFTGVTVAFKSTGAHTNIVHYASAGLAILLSVVGLAVIHGLWYLPIPILLFSALLGRKKNLIWWAEVVSIIHIFGAYLFI